MTRWERRVVLAYLRRMKGLYGEHDRRNPYLAHRIYHRHAHTIRKYT